MKYTGFDWLKKNEQAAIEESFAMMSYNPSIGRVLKHGGVIEFKKITIKEIRALKFINSQSEFDRFHGRFVKAVMNKIKKTSAGKNISYGHGQKAVNVFLKVYIDWASYPSKHVADKLRRFLHVPLDSWVMGYIKGERREDFNSIVNPVYKKQGKNAYNFSLSKIDITIYRAWQELCRKICPSKPVLLDVIWARAPR